MRGQDGRAIEVEDGLCMGCMSHSPYLMLNSYFGRCLVCGRIGLIRIPSTGGECVKLDKPK